MRFRATVERHGKTATGIAVPDDVVEALGSGRRPAVTVKVGVHTYRSTVATMGGRFFVGLSAENRNAAGVGAGDVVDVDIELDTAQREVVVPEELAVALGRDASAKKSFEALAYSHRKEWVRWVEESKRAETRVARVAKTIESLRAGKRSR